MIQLFKAFIAHLVCMTIVCISASLFATDYTITVDGSKEQGDVPHYWSRCCGTGGAQLCIKKEWKVAAKIGVEEAGFKAYRGHRILSYSNPLNWNGSGTPSYNWTKFDEVYDFLVDTLGTVPVVELSAQPRALETSGEWSPPKNLEVYEDMIKNVVSHCIERYGMDRVKEWYWEVWNEWDYSGFWSNGNEQQYYAMYKAAVQGATAAFPEVKIGGPSSTGSNRLSGFLNYCKSNNVKVDFVSNHCYGGGGSGPSANADNVRQDNRSRSNAIKSFGKSLVSMNTEYNTSYSGQGGGTGANLYSMDNHINAPFVVKCVKLILDDYTNNTYQLPEVFSYWAISDVFDEGSYMENHNLVPFGQVFGLINYQGVRKATFNAFKLLHMMGTTRLSLSGGTGSDGVDGFATVNDDSSEVAVIVYNFYSALNGQTAVDNVDLTVNNLPFPDGELEVRHYRIDETHSNAYDIWVKEGKPSKPSDNVWEKMRAASELAELNPTKTINYSGNPYKETIALPRQGVSFLHFKNLSATSIGENTKRQSSPRLSFSGGILTGSHLSGSNGISLSIFSMDGKLVKTCSTMQRSIDLRKVIGVRGVYLVHAQSGTKQITAKCIRLE